MTSEGEVELYCSGCGKYFEADVLIGPYSCDITLKGYEDTRISCDPPAYEELIDDWVISEHPSKTFQLSVHELREIIDTNASEYGGSTINRMIFTHIFTILEAYLCDNLIKGLRDNPALFVSFSMKDVDISKKISESDFSHDSNDAKNLIEQDLKKRIYHRFDNSKKAVPFWYRAAFGFSLSSDPNEIQKLRGFVMERHDCVHRNGEEKDGK